MLHHFIIPGILLVRTASAHTIFQELYVNGKSAGHLKGIRVPDSNSPLKDVTSPDIICNGGINPYHQPVSQAVIDVPAGATVTAEVRTAAAPRGRLHDQSEA